MSLKKTFLKHQPICRVTFRLPKEMVKDANQVSLVGEFNAWDPAANLMRSLKNGTYMQTLDLEEGKEYQFRYLTGDGEWENDPEADKYAASPFGVENSVVVTQQIDPLAN